MEINKVALAKTKEEAIQHAVDWQNWQSEQSMSYGELAVWMAVFKQLADEHDLQEEFKENGII